MVKQQNICRQALFLNIYAETITGFLVNEPRGVLLKVPFIDVHMSAENTPRGVLSGSMQTAVVTS